MSRSKQHRSEKRFVTYLLVRASSATGLIDMMRYDSCFPATEEDSRKIERLINNVDQKEDRILQLICAGRNDMTPTKDRWKSFCCTVLDVRHPDAGFWTQDEIAGLVRLNQATA